MGWSIIIVINDSTGVFIREIPGFKSEELADAAKRKVVNSTTHWISVAVVQKF